MTFETFETEIVKRMQDRFIKLEFGTEYVDKLQGRSYNGLIITEKEGSIGMTVNMDRLYRELEGGTPFDRILTELEDTVMNAEFPVTEINEFDLKDYQVLRENLTVQLVPCRGNEKLLSKVPHKTLDDLAVIYRVVLSLNENSEATILLTNENLEAYGVTGAQLEADAGEICEKKHPLSIRSMESVLFGVPEEEVENPGLRVIGNDTGRYGAAVISYPGALDRIAGKLGSGFYLIPSSVHEMLAVPDFMEMKAEDIDGMVKGVNSAEVLPEEQLSDHCYHYEKETGIFESGRTYEKRLSRIKKTR